jgi:uncharacterized protein (DUF1015 family)
MATIRPFAALLPKPSLAAQICELPYDVMSSEEARAMAAGNPLSFLHVSKPEIDLPPGTDLYSPAVYAKGKANLDRLMADGSLAQDSQPCFYLYRQVMGAHSQVGLVAAASCQPNTSKAPSRSTSSPAPTKKTTASATSRRSTPRPGPVFLTYRARPNLDDWIRQRMTGAPLVDFGPPMACGHTSWRIATTPASAFWRRNSPRHPVPLHRRRSPSQRGGGRVFQSGVARATARTS